MLTVISRRLLVLLPLGEGRDGGTHNGDSHSALAPPQTSPSGRENIEVSSPERGGSKGNLR